MSSFFLLLVLQVMLKRSQKQGPGFTKEVKAMSTEQVMNRLKVSGGSDPGL